MAAPHPTANPTRRSTSAYVPTRAYVQVPAEFLDLGPRKLCSETQCYMLMHIMRLTWSRACDTHGADPAEWSEPITAAMFAERCGCDLRTAEWNLADAVRRKMVARKKSPGRPGFCYRTTPAMWAAAADYAPAPPKEDEEHEPAEPIADTAEPEPPTPAGSLPPRVVMPGKAIALPFAIDHLSRVRYCNEGPAPLDIAAELQNGVLSLRFKTSPKLLKGEDSAKGDRNGLRSELYDIMRQVFQGVGLTLSKPFFRKIAAELQHVTDADYIRAVRNRLDRARRSNYPVDPGLFLLVAQDAAEAYSRKESPSQAPGRAEEPAPHHQPPSIEDLRNALQDRDDYPDSHPFHATALELIERATAEQIAEAQRPDPAAAAYEAMDDAARNELRRRIREAMGPRAGKLDPDALREEITRLAIASLR